MSLENLQKQTSPQPWPPAGVKWYYSDKWVAIACGDCREILPQLDVKVDLVLTDPPYVGLKGNQKLMNNIGVGKHYNNNPTVGDIWKANIEWMELCLKPLNYGIIAFCQFHDVHSMALEANKLGLKAIALGTWHARNSPPSVQNRPHYTTNFMWYLEKTPGLKWRKLETMYDIPKLATGCMATERIVDKDGCAIHPTQKPSELISKLLQVDAQTILDPFLGSGTTCYCAKKLNRYSIGIEIEEKYCEIAAKRCSQEVMELKI